MKKSYSVTVTLVVDREVGDIDPNVMEDIAEEIGQAVSEYDIGTISVFELPDVEPEPEPVIKDATILEFRPRKN